MLHEKLDEQVVTVLHKGSMYFFHVKCVGIKPPYQSEEVAPDVTTWMGQRAS
jgi:hypothetical protein